VLQEFHHCNHFLLAAVLLEMRWTAAEQPTPSAQKPRRMSCQPPVANSSPDWQTQEVHSAQNAIHKVKELFVEISRSQTLRGRYPSCKKETCVLEPMLDRLAHSRAAAIAFKPSNAQQVNSLSGRPIRTQLIDLSSLSHWRN
jgi:hypothetical protein